MMSAVIELIEQRANEPFGDGNNASWNDMRIVLDALRATEIERDRLVERNAGANADADRLMAERDQFATALERIYAEQLTAGIWKIGCSCSDRLRAIYDIAHTALGKEPALDEASK